MVDDEEKPEPGEDQPQMSITEQLKAQTELAREEEFKRTPAPPGKSKQLLVVMRHGERIDEVSCLFGSFPLKQVGLTAGAA